MSNQTTISHGEEVAEVINIATDKRSIDLFNKLPLDASDHLRRFALSRPEFGIVLSPQMMFDEHPNVPGKDQLHRQDPCHWYQAGSIHAVGAIKTMDRSQMLQIVDIGSPVEQKIAIAAIDNVTLTTLDVRPEYYHALMPFQTIIGTATKLPFPSDSVDVVTSNCVLCHVGDGRYGDAFDVDGDVNMLRECKRILKPGGVVLLGLGPISLKAILVFNMNRIYSLEWAKKLFGWAGLRPTDFWAFRPQDGEWITPDLMVAGVKGSPLQVYYGFVSLWKPRV